MLTLQRQCVAEKRKETHGQDSVIDDDPDAWRSPRLTLKKAGHKVIGTVRFDGS